MGIFEHDQDVEEVWLENTETTILEVEHDAIDINVLGETETDKKNLSGDTKIQGELNKPANMLDDIADPSTVKLNITTFLKNTTEGKKDQMGIKEVEECNLGEIQNPIAQTYICGTDKELEASATIRFLSDVTEEIIEDNETGLDKDNDYLPDEDSNEESSTDEICAENTDSAENVKRQRNAQPERWKCTIKKARRIKGLDYTLENGVKVKARSVGVPCTSTFCLKSDKRQCQDITPEMRAAVFEMFWMDMSTWPERKVFICSSVKQVPVKQVKVNNSRRHYTWEYSLKIKGKSYRVCKKMFASTLGMSERTIMSWVQDYSNGSTSDEGELSKSFEAVTEEAIQSS